MKADDVGLMVATAAVALVPLYLLTQLVRAWPTLFGPVALVLLGVTLLASVIRLHQRGMARVRTLDEVES